MCGAVPGGSSPAWCGVEAIITQGATATPARRGGRRSHVTRRRSTREVQPRHDGVTGHGLLWRHVAVAQRTKALERTRDHMEWRLCPGPEQRLPTRTSGIHGGTSAFSERWCEKRGRGSKFHSTGVIRRGGMVSVCCPELCTRVFSLCSQSLYGTRTVDMLYKRLLCTLRSFCIN